MVEKQSLQQVIKSLQLPAVVAFGNPLLDVVVTIRDANLLEKYKLQVDNEVELPEEIIQQILADLPTDWDQRVAAGGCAQNTARILQWLCGGQKVPHVVIFCGGKGDDSRGATLEKLVKASGVETRYAVHTDLPTGIALSLSRDSSRSLVANLGAAGVFTLSDLQKSNLPLDNLKIIYIEGFFLTHGLDVAKEVVKLTQDKNVIIAFNINGEYMVQDYHAAVCEMVGLSKIVFGNAREMTALAKALNLKFDNVADIPFLLNSSKRVTVGVSSAACSSDDWLIDNDIFVMTQGGSAPAIVVWGQGHSAQVQPTKPKTIVDATGAGDALVAGFLAGVLCHWDPKSCLECGCKTAGMMVGRLGVTLPETVPDDLLN
ncbi:adenosine kinase-like [Chelonus insularis]|uniref:adenosine kinase-like n=1 Tax=Chelonus insularis TaxID=460826 RepID=UPI00158BE05E|nr:adenosine kinase-like [Chelonus insularis]